MADKSNRAKQIARARRNARQTALWLGAVAIVFFLASLWWH